MIRLRVLGSIELENSDGSELRAILTQPKRFALLVYLASTPRVFHRRDTLLALFWPELDDARGRTSLNSAIRFLRKALGGPSGSVVVSRGAGELGIDSTNLWCDAAAFRDEIEAGRRGEALELYRGDFLPGFFSDRPAGFEEWMERERAWLRAQAAQAARGLAEARERDENFTTAVSTARRAVELSDGDERVVRELLELLDRLGDRSGAIHAYEAFADRLATEFDATPSAETMAVIERIRARSQTNAGALGAAGPAARSVEPNAATAPLAKLAPPIGAPGAELSRWQVVRTLGHGGMATVHLARDLKHERHVALKTLLPESLLSGGAERFLREIQITASLAHPHILPLIDSGAAEGALYLVTPYIAGESLRVRLRREPRLPLMDALRIATEVSEALDYAHRCGIIHRDIKPENILLADGHAVVADFGVSRALAVSGVDTRIPDSDPGAVVGSRPYMSPEQAGADADVGPRTDLYALGCVLFEMLTGELAAGGESPRAVLSRRADVSPTIARLVSDCIAKKPERRPKSAADVLRALGNVRSDAPAGRVEVWWRVWSRTSQWRSRRSLVVAAGILAALALAIPGVRALSARPAAALSQLVAVMPFRISTADSTLAWLSEGMVELLTVRLAGEGGIQVAEPGSVLSAWHREAPSERVRQESLHRVSAAVNAGRIIEGSVTGTSRDVVLTAWILSMPGGRVAARATAEGSPDSLPFLVDRLAGQLLGVTAGFDESRLATLTSTSLPAIRAYLAGRASVRAGRMEDALPQFRAAVGIDSTFALAALALARGSLQLLVDPEDFGRGKRLALSSEHRLSAVDRALLHVTALDWTSANELFVKAHAAVSAYPDRPEFWYGLGEAYLHSGPPAGIDSSFERAAYALRRGWQLDSVASGNLLSLSTPLVAEPVRHMVELAQLRGDTAEVRALSSRVLAVDSTSELATVLRWHRAVADGESARHAYWDDLGRGPERRVLRIVLFMLWTGIGAEDYGRAIAEHQRSLRADGDRNWIDARIETPLNQGRPSQVVRQAESSARGSRAEIRDAIHNALYWGGDTVAGRDAARQLARWADAPPTNGSAARPQYLDICTVGQWRAAHGDMAAANTASRRLRAAGLARLTADDSVGRVLSLCAALLDASRATALALPDARARLLVADSLARASIFQVCCNGSVSGANLLLARLWERQGDLPRALQAVRRRSARFLRRPNYLSTFVREEGRLAALTGDRDGAIRAYRHYLALRYDPEPALRPEADRVRRELAALLRDQ